MLKLMHPFIFKLIVIISLIFVLAVCSDGESEETVDHSMLLNGVPQQIELGSSVFSDGGYLHGAHTCYGLDRSPPLFWGEVPENTQSLALIVNEPTAEEQPDRVNWVIYDLPPEVREIPGVISIMEENVLGGKQGRNHSGGMGWAGPCPDPGIDHEGTYVFHIYALDNLLDIQIEGGVRRNDVLRAMSGHVIDYGKLTGKFCKSGGAAKGGWDESGGRGSCPALDEQPED